MVTQCGECGMYTEGAAERCAFCDEEFTTWVVNRSGDLQVGYAASLGCGVMLLLAGLGAGIFAVVASVLWTVLR